MGRAYFQTLEQSVDDISLELKDVIDMLAFNEKGLIPAIAQDAINKDILMMAWMNKEALYNTVLTRNVTYWSRSRKKIWTKGETSGHTQFLVSMSFDCDGDTVLCQVNQSGAACHTGRANCFYLAVDVEQQQVVAQAMPL